VGSRTKAQLQPLQGLADGEQEEGGERNLKGTASLTRGSGKEASQKGLVRREESLRNHGCREMANTRGLREVREIGGQRGGKGGGLEPHSTE